MWEHPFDAFWAGFSDGFRGILDRPVPNFGRDYELGFVLGWKAKQDLEDLKGTLK